MIKFLRCAIILCWIVSWFLDRNNALLPLNDVVMILGNGLAGRAVGANVPPSPVVNSKPQASGKLDERSLELPGVFPVCAMTHVQSRKVPTPDPPVWVAVKV